MLSLLLILGFLSESLPSGIIIKDGSSPMIQQFYLEIFSYMLAKNKVKWVYFASNNF